MGHGLPELGGDRLYVDPAERSILEHLGESAVGGVTEIDPVIPFEAAPDILEPRVAGADGGDDGSEKQSVEVKLELLATPGECPAREPEWLTVRDQGHRRRVAKKPLDLGQQVGSAQPVGMAIEDLRCGGPVPLDLAKLPADRLNVSETAGETRIATLTEGNEYSMAGPIESNIRIINRLHELGHNIVLFTARGNKTGIDWSEVTKKQMADWNVSYDQLFFGKPHSDFYIDDRLIEIHAISKILEACGDA